MSRKQQTTATFHVRLVLPKGSNCQQAQQWIRDALQSNDRWRELFGLDPGQFTVALVKKETCYGS